MTITQWQKSEIGISFFEYNFSPHALLETYLDFSQHKTRRVAHFKSEFIAFVSVLKVLTKKSKIVALQSN